MTLWSHQSSPGLPTTRSVSYKKINPGMFGHSSQPSTSLHVYEHFYTCLQIHFYLRNPSFKLPLVCDTYLPLTSRNLHRFGSYQEAGAPRRFVGTGAGSTGARWASPGPTVWWHCGRQPSAMWSLCSDSCSPACPAAAGSHPQPTHNARCSVSTECQPPSHPALHRQHNDEVDRIAHVCQVPF